MLFHVGFWILEAALRSLLMALAVWAGIRLFRVQAVLAQKVAWVLVLLAAGTMPIVMRVARPVLDRAGVFTFRIPAARMMPWSQSAVEADSSRANLTEPLQNSRVAPIAKPAAGRPLALAGDSASILLFPVERSASSPKTPSKARLRSVPIAPFAGPELYSSRQAVSGESASWSPVRIKLMLAVLYFAVVATLLIRALLGLGVAYRIWSRSEPIANPKDGAIVVTRAHAPPLSNIRISNLLTTPVTIGSTVILPADYREWDAAKLRIVLAHEQSHVRQGDFYLQLLAAIHVAIFWFSPLGWWLQRKLSELGEALSDRAGLEQAPNAASYAQVLLEFAATPRTTPIAGVAMARSSNLSSRIDRILNPRNFRLAFLGGRRHALLAAVIVPAALMAAVACVRIVPAVQAAQAPGTAQGTTSSQSPSPISGQVSGQVTGQVSGQISGEVEGQVTDVDSPQAAPPAPPAIPVAPAAPNPPVPDVAPPAAPEPEPAPNVHVERVPEPPMPPQHPESSSFGYSDDDEENGSFAVIRGNGNVTLSGRAGEELELAKRKYHNNFIWFERNGKSYVITDPAIMAQAQSILRSNPSLEIKKKQLDQMQAKLNDEMARMRPEIERATQQNAEMQTRMAELQNKLSKLQIEKLTDDAEKAFPPEEQAKLNQEMAALAPELAKIKVPGPEFEAQMAKLHAELAELQSDRFKKLTDDMNKKFSEEKLEELQEKIGDIQGSIGDIQGEIGERQGELGERQGELGERMGRIGEEMGRIGEQEGRDAEAASRRMKSFLDQAVRNGKAVPVN